MFWLCLISLNFGDRLCEERIGLAAFCAASMRRVDFALEFPLKNTCVSIWFTVNVLQTHLFLTIGSDKGCVSPKIMALLREVSSFIRNIRFKFSLEYQVLNEILTVIHYFEPLHGSTIHYRMNTSLFCHKLFYLEMPISKIYLHFYRNYSISQDIFTCVAIKKGIACILSQSYYEERILVILVNIEKHLVLRLSWILC